MAKLPVDEVLPELLAALNGNGHAVVVAPPGSGKTTRVPVALLDAFGDRGEVVVTQPRRAAARVVARYVARSQPQGRVGFEVRGERKVGPQTRLRFVTEGVLLAQLLADPELSKVSCVVIDEFHERSLIADTLLALLVESASVLREDLHIVVMSATLAADPVAAFLGECPVVAASGRQFPVDVRYAPGQSSVGAAMAACDAIDGGDVLVFLPGVREIDRAHEQLRAGGYEVARLHGSLPLAEQDRVISASSAQGRPRVVLSTNIAETSLTLPGVTAVVDSGQVKQHRHDPASGVDRLELREHSQASAEQRSGRAGRVRAGVAWRLWTEREQLARPEFDTPSIRRVDLAPMLLWLRRWGVNDAASFAFFEVPPAAHLARAESLLVALGAVATGDGAMTPIGEAMARLPVHPRVARFLLAGRDEGIPALACQAAMLLEEPRWFTAGHGQSGAAGRSDLGRRLRGFHRANAGLRAAGERLARQYARVMGCKEPLAGSFSEGEEAALCRALLAGWPDRVAVRREEGRPEVVMGDGQGGILARSSVVTHDTWMVAIDVGNPVRGSGTATLPLIRSAAGLSWDDLSRHQEFRQRDVVAWDADRARVTAERVWELRGAVLKRTDIPLQDRVRAAEELQRAVERIGIDAIKMDRATTQLLGRLHVIEPSVDAWRWVAPALPGACTGKSSLEQLRAASMAPHIRAALAWDVRPRLDSEAPIRLKVPSGRQVAVTYRLNAPPSLAVKAQEMFGVSRGPRLGRTPVRIELLDPAGRPLAVTDDLESFWANAWVDVRKEMRGRYPKHRWPESPQTEQASVKSLKPRRRK